MGVDQDTFLDFIDTFNKSILPNPWINTLNLVGFVEYAVPEPAMMLLGIGLDIATTAALEAHSRFRSNKFLDRVNEGFFNPRGLMCHIVTWQTEVNYDGRVDGLGEMPPMSRSDPDFFQSIKDVAAQKTSAEDGWEAWKGQMGEMMRPFSSDFASPEPAPLVFPSLDTAATGEGKVDGVKKKNALDRSEKWVDEYMDKRSQAKWVVKHAGNPAANALAKPEFRSRYADPNHPAASGDVVALVTGGRWQYNSDEVDSKKAAKKDKEEEKKRKKEEAKKERQEAEEAKKEAERAKRQAKKKQKQEAEKEKKEAKMEKEKKKKRKTEGSEDNQSDVDAKLAVTEGRPVDGNDETLLKKDVLYLVVVNLPSKEETMQAGESIV
ncbi:hypothetical protein CCHL11_07606 [Colletotrichum chlorophyti]|uniref:Uncharacterized protein n=1 Tax=Colletotrichum chlorophyti TaxID=708187 RepID=A0A1Q8RZQ1_9PEZI|nr:hypothetical protein CCHL11_07606 [Colletotrichum chlorophyti]